MCAGMNYHKYLHLTAAHIVVCCLSTVLLSIVSINSSMITVYNYNFMRYPCFLIGWSNSMHVSHKHSTLTFTKHFCHRKLCNIMGRFKKGGMFKHLLLMFLAYGRSYSTYNCNSSTFSLSTIQLSLGAISSSCSKVRSRFLVRQHFFTNRIVNHWNFLLNCTYRSKI